MRKIKEAIQLFDSGDTRSFNEIYAGKENLFEDIDDVISPKMKALFESVYATVNGESQMRIHLKEDLAKHDGPKPSGDGVSNAHNPALSKGPTSEVTQSGARQDDDSKLGNEPAMGHGAGPKKSVASGTVQFQEAELKDIFEKAQLKENFELDDDYVSEDADSLDEFHDSVYDGDDDSWGDEFGSDYLDYEDMENDFEFDAADDEYSLENDDWE